MSRAIARHLKTAFVALRRPILLAFDAVLALACKIFQKGPFIRQRIAASDPMRTSPRAAIYVHYDPAGEIHDFVVHQLRELVDAGFRVTFVSNAPVFPAASVNRIAGLCKEIIRRFNTGYDFGAYKDGVAALDNIARLEALIVMNDSVYGPFQPIAAIMDKAVASGGDFWGVTESLENRRHLQTFFLIFFPKAITSKAFARFWDALPYVDRKWWIVRNAEAKLTEALVRDGLKGSVLAPYDSVAAIAGTQVAQSDGFGLSSDRQADLERYRERVKRGVPLNPTHYFWDVLIAQFDFPFIKRDLLLGNPASIPSLDRWRDVIAAKSNYDTTMIDRHLDALRKRQTPDLADLDAP